MNDTITILEDDSTPDGVAFLFPQVHPVVYLAPGQRKPSYQQATDAIVEAYIQAARRGEVCIIRNIGKE